MSMNQPIDLVTELVKMTDLAPYKKTTKPMTLASSIMLYYWAIEIHNSFFFFFFSTMRSKSLKLFFRLTL